MQLVDLQKFLDDCMDKGVQIPPDMKVVLTDFTGNIPEEYENVIDLEYNHRHSKDGNRANRIKIVKDLETKVLSAVEYIKQKEWQDEWEISPSEVIREIKNILK